MTDSKPAIEEVSGYLGVGSLELLGIFFILDGISEFLEFIEIYAKTSTWAVLVTVPALVVAYVIGVFSSLGAEIVLSRYMRPILTPELFAYVTSSKNEQLVQRYADAERHSRLLYGCSIAFFLLAIGSWLEVRMMGKFGFVGYVGLVAGLGISLLCPLLARYIQAELIPFVEAVRALNATSA
ncbi:MAG: hypothetical protein Q7U16_06905 [Agitococcus sp.]|nr:hypothetical protein [Agitococcus sp.]